MRVEVKKVYRGIVSVRDYLVEKAKRLQEDLVIYNDRGEMVIPYEYLDKGSVMTRSIPSKFGSKRYNLVDYRWNPILKDENQLELF